MNRSSLLKSPLIILIQAILFFTYPLIGKSQSLPGLQFQQINSDEGLSQNYISCLLQDDKGYMWIGTKDGLNRYDGYQFEIYRKEAFNPASLSHSYITSLHEDPHHNLWAGTVDGSLNLFDREKNRFLPISMTTAGIKNSFPISAISSGSGDSLWIGTASGDIFLLEFSSGKKDSLFREENNLPLRIGLKPIAKLSERINCFYKDGTTLWIGTEKGVKLLDMKNPSSTLHIPFFPAISKVLPAHNSASQTIITHEEIPAKKFAPILHNIHGIRGEKNGNIWIVSDTSIFQFNKELKKYISFHSGEKHHESRLIRSLAINENSIGKKIWAGLYSGLAILNLEDSTINYYYSSSLQKRGGFSGATISACFDKSGTLWLGSSGFGLNTFSPEVSLFNRPDNSMSNDWRNISNLSVRSFYQFKKTGKADPAQPLWLGAQSGLYEINLVSGLGKKIELDIFRKENINSVIHALDGDNAGNLWAGFEKGLIRYQPATGKSTIWQVDHSDNSAGTPAHSRVLKIVCQNTDTIWLITDHALIKFQPSAKHFTFYPFPSSFSSQENIGFTYPVMYLDKENKIWLGTHSGLFYFDPVQEKYSRHYMHNPLDTHGLSANWITSIYPDFTQPEKIFWIGTAGGGLNKFDLETATFLHLMEQDGLPNNNIYGILGDSLGTLWISTNKGISRFNPATKLFTNFDIANNLQDNEFNFGAFYKNHSGTLFFGGIKGFNYFTPRKIHSSQITGPLLITGFRITGDPAKQGFIVPENMDNQDKIHLPYNLNNFTITLSSMDFSAPSKNEYAYRLLNKNENWVYIGTERHITFTDVPPGEYIFQAKATNSTGYWNPEIKQFIIFISRPWWKTDLAYIFYMILGVAAIVFLRKRELARVVLKNKLELEEIEAGKLKELDEMKSRFFANISHEFRTPLTLIIGPLEDAKREKDPQSLKKLIPAMLTSSKRILQLINQILDLSRLDAHKYHIHTDRQDIIPFVQLIVNSFSSLSIRKDIQLEVKVDPFLRKKLIEEDIFYFDSDVLEKILTNLLSNAFKFTPAGGFIEVGIEIYEKDSHYLHLQVKDNGTGLPKEKASKLFDRYYQGQESDSFPGGSGIGLALVRELVEMHQGKVFVNTELDMGTTFSCIFPFENRISKGKKNSVKLQNDYATLAKNKDNAEVFESTAHLKKDKPLILVVDDQPEMRNYIISRLYIDYSIMEAGNGNEALRVATHRIPDLIISDVMMPGMEGFELCRLLKTDTKTSHIPIILLTALAGENDKIGGLSTGADAYLVKPFNSKELLVRVQNLIAIRNKMRAKFSKRLEVKPSEIAVTPQDSQFVQKLLETIEREIDNSQFTVNDLAKEANMSISQLNRKLKAIINQSASRFIQSVRLHRALDLLKNEAGNISEIAYQTGFETPSYFSKVFKSYFGYLPSEKEKFMEK